MLDQLAQSMVLPLPGSGTGPQAPAGTIPARCGQMAESCQDRVSSQGWSGALPV